MIAGWVAVTKVLLGKKSWAKTERLKENSDGIAEGKESADMVDDVSAGQVNS